MIGDVLVGSQGRQGLLVQLGMMVFHITGANETTLRIEPKIARNGETEVEKINPEKTSRMDNVLLFKSLSEYVGDEANL